MSTVEQTNRTILFEKINGGKQNLLSLIGGIEHRESLTDEEVQEMHQFLEVSSFDEFLKKMEPSIYVQLDTEQNQVYTHIGDGDSSWNCEKHIIDTENSFFALLIETMDRKRKRQFRVSGYEKLLNQLISNKKREEMIQARENLVTNFLEGNKEQTEKDIQEIVASYDIGSYLLELYLQEAYVYLTEWETEEKRYSRAILEKKKDYEIYPIKVAKNVLQRKILLNDRKKREYEQFVCATLEKMKTIRNRRLLQYWITLPCIREENLEQFQVSYGKYMELYSKLIKDYWYTAKPIMETMLGIREFFEQYGEVQNGMQPVLVISNCTPEEFKDEKGKRALHLYLETVNHKNFYRNTIWYAIIPNLQFAEREGKALTRERFRGSKGKNMQNIHLVQDVQVLTELLSQYAIESFVSVSVMEESSTDGLMKQGLDSFEASFQELQHMEHKEYVIPCYPNFLVMKSAQAQRSVGFKMCYDEMEECFCCLGNKKVHLSEIGIGAAYIAAGLQAACQCPKYLERFYKNKVEPETPGVAYHVDYEDKKQRIPTGMTMETMHWNKEVVRKILYQGKGMVLLPIEGKVIALTARTLNYNSTNRETVSTVQTITYMERKIRYVTQDFKQNLIVQFFQNRPGSIREQWGNSRQCVNGLLKQGESLEYEIDEKNHTCTFKLLLQESERQKTVFIT